MNDKIYTNKTRLEILESIKNAEHDHEFRTPQHALSYFDGLLHYKLSETTENLSKRVYYLNILLTILTLFLVVLTVFMVWPSTKTYCESIIK